jgi:hypothetical protein
MQAVPTMLELVPRGINKWVGMERLLADLGLEAEQVASVYLGLEAKRVPSVLVPCEAGHVLTSLLAWLGAVAHA